MASLKKSQKQASEDEAFRQVFMEVFNRLSNTGKDLFSRIMNCLLYPDNASGLKPQEQIIALLDALEHKERVKMIEARVKQIRTIID